MACIQGVTRRAPLGAPLIVKPNPKPAPMVRLRLKGLVTTIDLDQVIGKRKDETRWSARQKGLTDDQVGVLLRATDCSTHLHIVDEIEGMITAREVVFVYLTIVARACRSCRGVSRWQGGSTRPRAPMQTRPARRCGRV